MLKRISLFILLGVGTFQIQAQKRIPRPSQFPQNPTQPQATVLSSDSSLRTESDSLSYSIGLNIGSALSAQGVESINKQAFLSAVEAILEKKPVMVSMEKSNQIITRVMRKLQEKKFEQNKVIGAKFLEENKSKKGVIALPSGLQYEILVAGSGAIPKATDKVKAHYHGTLLDGTVFDSSVQRNQPLEIGVNQVIKGWTEALQLMPVGSKWKLYIPYDLAYGEQGAGGAIKPYSTLIFEVEVLSIL